MNTVKNLSLVAKSVIAAMALAVGFHPGAFADDVDPYADYIKLTANDTEKNTSWNKTGHWSEEFSTERNYYVPAGKTFYTDGRDGAAGTWTGGELVIAGTMVTPVRTGFGRAPKVPNLVFLNGSVLRGSAYGILASPSRMTVRATADNPLVIQMQWTNSSDSYRSRLFADIYGDPGTGIRIEALSDAAVNDFTYYTETFTNFYGTLTVTGEKVNVFRAESDSHYFTMPGKLIVTDSAVFMPSYSSASTPHTNVLVGALEVIDGGIADFPAYKDAACVTLGLTNSLKIADGGVVRVSNIDAKGLAAPANSGAADDYRLAVRIANLTGDAAIASDIDNAKVTMVNKSYDEAFGWELFTREGVGGSKDVYVGVTNMAVCIKTLTNGANPTDPTCWGGGVLPKEGVDFYFPYRFNPFNNWDFTQSKLILDNAGSVSHYWTAATTMDLNAKAYYVLNSCGIIPYKNGNRRWRGGPLTLADGATLSFSLQSPNPQLRIESEVRGNGGLLFKTYSDNANYYYQMTLENLNTNWHGRLTVYAYTNATYTYNTILGDARNWGGEFLADANTYSAVTLGTNACVYVTNNVCFSDPTRGFLLRNAPQFKVKEGFTLTLSNQVTYAGVVTKSNTGVLELGGTARFIDGQAETAPVEGLNGLAIAAGALKVSSKEACDGLAISFAEGTGLIIPAGSADGLYDVKWDAPLTTTAADGKIAVEIDAAGAALPENGFTTTIATLNATAAADVPEDFFKVAKIAGYKMMGVTKRTTEDGVAYDVKFAKYGTVFYVR